MGSGNSKERSISLAEAQQFSKAYNAFIENNTPKSDDTAGNVFPGLMLSYGEDNWSYGFIETMREGGVTAAMEMVKKKHGEIRQYPQGSPNNILGVVFEELQIAKIMAEVKRRKLPIDLIAGDGRGVFTVNGCNLRSPEYTDAVFHNTTTDEYFAVQFKFSDKPEYLVEMMNAWRGKHQNKPGQPHMPEAMNLENVQLIGPRDVVDRIGGAEFQKKIKLGFEMRPENYKKMLKFINDNKQILKSAVNDERYTQRFGELKKQAEAMTNLNKTHAKKNRQLKENEAKMSEKRSDDLLKELADIEKRISTHANNIKSIDKDLRAELKQELVAYKHELPVKALLKDVGKAAVVGAVVDGIISLVASSEENIRKYLNKEITGSECAKQIVNDTALASIQGAAIGGSLATVAAVSKYATAAGWTCAPALSGIAKYAGPVVLITALSVQVGVTAWNYWYGYVTQAELSKALARAGSGALLTSVGMYIAAAAIGGPVGLVAGACIAIAVGVGDATLGDYVWSLLFKEDPKEVAKVVKTRAIHMAYELLRLKEDATDSEIHKSYKAAILMYHPDKGGNAVKFQAVRAAHALISQQRKKLL